MAIEKPRRGPAAPVPVEELPNVNVEPFEVKMLIDGQRIAVIGNAKSILKSPKDIDGYDVVIRINRGGTPGISPECLGTRTDVWALAGCLEVEKDRILNLVKPKQVWWMGRRAPGEVQNPHLEDMAFFRPASIHTELRQIFGCNPSTGALVVYFLTTLAPASVTIFGMDWWRSEDRQVYGPGVLGWNTGPIKRCLSHNLDKEEALIRKIVRERANYHLVEG